MTRRDRRPRRLAAQEHALWKAVTDTVSPLERPGARTPPEATDQQRKAPFVTSAKQIEAARQDPPSVPPQPRKPAGNAAPSRRPTATPPAPGDPRLVRRIARGRRPIDATLDLHGLTQREAQSRLIRFVEFARLRGDRVLLVITGKGPPTGDRPADPFGEAPRGILRRRFQEWVASPPLSHHVSAVEEAHQRHGGRGAFYVMVRKG